MVVQTPEEGERQRGLSAVYGQNRILSLHCLPLAEGGSQTEGRVLVVFVRTSVGVVPVWFVHYVRYIFSS